MSSHHYAKTPIFSTGILIILALVGAGAEAADVTWTGANNSNWNNALNWLTVPPGGVPVNGDALVFNAPVPPNQPSNNNLNNLRATAVTFDAAAGAHTLGGNGLTLGWRPTTSIAYTGDIINSSTANQTVNNAITLEAARHVISTQGSALNLHGPISQSKASVVQFFTNVGAINLAGSGLTNTNGILGGWATVNNTAGSSTLADWATLDGSNNVVPYTAYTEVTDGGTPGTSVIADAPASNVRITAASATATTLAVSGGDTRINTLLLGPSGAASTLTIGAGNRLVLGQNGGIFNASAANGNTLRNLTIGTAGVGDITAGDGVNPATITISGSVYPSASGIMTINSNIKDNNGAPVAVVLSGGYVTPNAASVNTFSGGLYILSGRWSQPNGTSIGAGPVHIFPGGMINPGAGTPVTIANNLFIAGHGTTENAGLGAVRMFQNTNGNSTLLTGTITLTDTASVTSNGLTQVQIDLGRHVGITGKITGPGGFMVTSPSFNAGNNNGTGIVEIGPLTGAPTSANDYAGDTTINGGQGGGSLGGTLRIMNPDADNIMPHGPTGSFSGGPTGNLVLNAQNSSRNATFDLNGSDQVINGLSNTVTSPENNFVQNMNTSLPARLTLGDSNATATFDGVIRDNDGSFTVTTNTLSITKIGSGSQTLTGGMSYTGNTSVTAGTLSFAPASGFSNFADAADILVSSGAFLNLNYVGQDTIRYLYLNGTPMAPGTYNAANGLGRLTGTGELIVSMLGPSLGVAGDYNNNGIVDAADYAVWRKNVGTMTALPNDPTGGTIGQTQYDTWKANFGKTPGSGSGLGQTAAVPEPAAMVLALAAFIAWGLIRGRRGD